MTDILPDHTHCLMCDDPVPVKEQFCSDECREAFDTNVKKEARRMNYFYIGAIAAVIMVSVILFILRIGS